MGLLVLCTVLAIHFGNSACSPLPSSVFLNLFFSPLPMPYPLFILNFKPHRYFDRNSHKSHIPAFITEPMKLNLSLFFWDRFWRTRPLPSCTYARIMLRRHFKSPYFCMKLSTYFIDHSRNIYIKPVVFLGVVFVESSKIVHT